MYENCKIITPIGLHKYTFIMLHPMYGDATYFNDYITYFKNKFTACSKCYKTFC